MHCQKTASFVGSRFVIKDEHVTLMDSRASVRYHGENGREKVRLDPQAARLVQGGTCQAARCSSSKSLSVHVGGLGEDRGFGKSRVVVAGSDGRTVGGSKRPQEQAAQKKESRNRRLSKKE